MIAKFSGYSVPDLKGGVILETEPELGASRIRIPAGQTVETYINELKKKPETVYAEPDYTVRAFARVAPDDIYFNKQWNLEKISAPLGWDIEKGTTGIIIAIIDTGISRYHVDLSSKLWFNQREIPGNGIDEDKNGYIDDYFGYDFINGDGEAQDDHGHGTACAGIASALTNNTTGCAGVAWYPTLMAVKVLSKSGSGTAFSISRGIIYAAKNGAKVLSMSLGSPYPYRSSIEEEAVLYAYNRGCVVVAAAGNSNDRVGFPAGYDSVIAVGASNEWDERKSPTSLDGEGWGSCYGPELDVMAPGVHIFTTSLTLTLLYGYYTDSFNGTSSACPHVAGLAALILSKWPDKPPWEVQRIIEQTADDFGAPRRDDYFGSGRINVYRALTLDYNNKAQFSENTKPKYKILTPGNNDGINDTLKFGIDVRSFRIFDLRGRLVYSSKPGDDPEWTLKDNDNNTVESGPYIWELKDGQDRTGRGGVVIAR